MTTVSQPFTTVAIAGANTVVQNANQKILLVGQGLGGTAGGGSLVENLPLDFSVVNGLFGENSMLAAMYRAAREINEINQIDAIVLDDNGAGFATGTITITGTATAAGELTFTIGSEINHKFTVAVAVGDDATTIATLIDTVINGSTDLPVTSSESGGVLTLTAVNAGTLGNNIGLSISPSGTVTGVSTAIAAMAGGAGDPDLTDVFDVIGDKRYQGIVWPYWANTQELRSLLDGRWNTDNKVIDGVGFTSSVDTLSNHLTRLGALNSQTLVDFADKTTAETWFTGPAQQELPYVKAAQFAAIRALRLSDGTSIGQYVLAANGPADAFGGPALASKPYFNTPTPDLPLIGTGRGWIDTEIEQLHDAGGSVLGQNPTGNAAIAGEIVTTYKNDPAGNPDISWKYLNYVDTMSNIREYYFNNLRKRFAQSRLTEGDIQRGRDMANGLVISGYCTQLYQDLSGPDFVLVEAGEDSLNFFKLNLSVTIDKANGRATILSKVVIVTQLREIIQTLQLSFTTEG